MFCLALHVGMVDIFCLIWTIIPSGS